MKVGVALLLLASCAEEEPPPSGCAHLPTKVVLGWVGGAWSDYVPPLAVGGHLSASLECATNGNLSSTPPGPYEIDDGGASAVRATVTEQGIVELDAVAPGTNTITIGGKWIIDTSLELRAAAVSSATIDVDTGGRPWVWAPGIHRFAVSIHAANGERLYGLVPTTTFTNNGVTMVGSPIEVNEPGDYAIDVTAGPFQGTAPFTISNMVDTIALDRPADLQIRAGTSESVCFSAYDQARVALGHEWSISGDANIQPGVYGCAFVLVDLARRGQTLTLTVSAGGTSTMFPFEII